MNFILGDTWVFQEFLRKTTSDEKLSFWKVTEVNGKNIKFTKLDTVVTEKSKVDTMFRSFTYKTIAPGNLTLKVNKLISKNGNLFLNNVWIPLEKYNPSKEYKYSITDKIVLFSI